MLCVNGYSVETLIEAWEVVGLGKTVRLYVPRLCAVVASVNCTVPVGEDVLDTVAVMMSGVLNGCELDGLNETTVVVEAWARAGRGISTVADTRSKPKTRELCSRRTKTSELLLTNFLA